MGGSQRNAVFQALQLLDVPFPYWRKVMDAAKSYGVPHTRDYGLAFSRTVQRECGLSQSYLLIYDNREEPINVLCQFALLNSAMGIFDLVRFLVLPHICEFLTCQILVPLVFTEILSNKDREALRRLGILRGKEPVDLIDRLIQVHGLAAVYRDKASIYR